jgi:hypothetical protein
VFENAEIISRYSRADAIRDGVLIDVSAVAREAGIRYPVALTCAVWEQCASRPGCCAKTKRACRARVKGGPSSTAAPGRMSPAAAGAQSSSAWLWLLTRTRPSGMG